jgi:CheY-like chemotaxis protein
VQVRTSLGAKRLPEPYAPAILVVDDDSQVRTLCRRVLEETGYFATEARDGRDALRAIGSTFFEAMVVDLSMPDMDGFEVLRIARAEFPRMKVIIMSGFMSGALLSAARLLGASATLDKPFNSEILLSVVCQVLSAA